MKRSFLKRFWLMLCLAAVLIAAGLTAYAIDPIDAGKTVSAAVTFRVGEKPVPGAEFSLYRIADTDEWVKFTASGDFAAYPGELNGFETSAEWDAAAEKLVKYIAEQKISPLAKAKTDENGTVIFDEKTAGREMKPGLYLLTSGETTYDGKIYTSVPGLMCLPTRAEGSDSWIYENAPILIKAGEVKDIPDTPPMPPPTPPDIPHTGVLWWPVPVLLMAGLLLLVLGAARRRSCREE